MLKAEREKERRRTGPGCSQEPSTPSRSPTWVSRAQILGASAAAFLDASARGWVGSGHSNLG